MQNFKFDDKIGKNQINEIKKYVFSNEYKKH